eukprot:1060917-Amphidinium_carterae.1
MATLHVAKLKSAFMSALIVQSSGTAVTGMRNIVTSTMLSPFVSEQNVTIWSRNCFEYDIAPVTSGIVVSTQSIASALRNGPMNGMTLSLAYQEGV